MVTMACIAASASTLPLSALWLPVFDEEGLLLPAPAAAADSPFPPDFFAKLARW
jgi:hypothetical protein